MINVGLTVCGLGKCRLLDFVYLSQEIELIGILKVNGSHHFTDEIYNNDGVYLRQQMSTHYDCLH